MSFLLQETSEVIWRVRVRHQAKTGIKTMGSKVLSFPKTAEITKKPVSRKSEVRRLQHLEAG